MKYGCARSCAKWFDHYDPPKTNWRNRSPAIQFGIRATKTGRGEEVETRLGLRPQLIAAQVAEMNKTYDSVSLYCQRFVRDLWNLKRVYQETCFAVVECVGSLKVKDIKG